MTGDVARAPAICQNLVGTSLAALAGIGKSVELAAMPLPATEAQLPGPTLIQQSTEPDATTGRPRAAFRRE